MKPFDGDLHAGLSGLQFEDDFFDLGEGVSLRKTYVHLMAPFVMAFKPAPPGSHHPGPWKAATGGFAFDVVAELTIPAAIEERYGATDSILKTVVFLIRLGIDPATTVPILSSHAFAELPGIPENHVKLFPFEIDYRYFPLSIESGAATSASLEWVKNRWPITQKLINDSAEFALAVDSVSTGQFVKSSALTLVSLWAALEALFSPSTTELKFRMSALIAAFLEPPGVTRSALQKEISKLYDKRSGAAHGKPRHEQDDLLSSFNLIRRVLIAIIDNRRVPSKQDLEDMLFGSLLKPGG